MLAIYSDQVHLLISVLPHVAKERCFALKGGTAINLFVRNMPRVSVDIDLSYLPVEDRDTSLKTIDTALNNIETNTKKAIPGSIINKSLLTGTGYCNRLLISREGVTVKVEVTPVLRGSVHPPQEKEMTANAETLTIASNASCSSTLLSIHDSGRTGPRFVISSVRSA